MQLKAKNTPEAPQDVEAMVCWFSQKPMETRGKYLLRHTMKETKAIVQELRYQVDIETLHKKEGTSALGMNDIGRIALRTAKGFACRGAVEKDNGSRASGYEKRGQCKESHLPRRSIAA